MKHAPLFLILLALMAAGCASRGTDQQAAAPQAAASRPDGGEAEIAHRLLLIFKLEGRWVFEREEVFENGQWRAMESHHFRPWYYTIRGNGTITSSFRGPAGVKQFPYEVIEGTWELLPEGIALDFTKNGGLRSVSRWSIEDGMLSFGSEGFRQLWRSAPQ